MAADKSTKLPWEDTQDQPALRPDDTTVSDTGVSPLEAQQATYDQASPFDEKPELLVGAAFAGGLVLAQLLRRLGSDD